jgi:hypothetical protein
MDEQKKGSATSEEEARKAIDERSQRDRRGFDENPAAQGLKAPPPVKSGEDSGEWPRGGGSDPNEGPPKPKP